jgi:hypothetical protein
MTLWRLLSSYSALFSDQFVQYMFKVVLRDLTCLIWVGFWNESYRYFQYLSGEYLFANFGWIVWEIWICKIAVSFVVRIVGSVQNLFKVVLGNLWSSIYVGLQHERCISIQCISNEYSYVIFSLTKAQVMIFLMSVVHWALGSDWTLVPWERSVLRRVLNLFRERIWYYLYEMFCSIYLLLSV